MPFGTDKLEWRDYPTVKKIDDVVIRFDTTHECDRQTDRHCMTAKAALDASCRLPV